MPFMFYLEFWLVILLSLYSDFQMNTTSCYKLVSLWALSSKKTLLYPLLHFLTLSTRPWGPPSAWTWSWVAVQSLIPPFAFTISASAHWCCCAWERSQGEPEGRRSWGYSAEERKTISTALEWFSIAVFCFGWICKIPTNHAAIILSPVYITTPSVSIKREVTTSAKLISLIFWINLKSF